MVGGPVGTTVAALARILGRDKMMSMNAMKLNDLIRDTGFQTFLKNNPSISQAELLSAIAGREPKDTNQQ